VKSEINQLNVDGFRPLVQGGHGPTISASPFGRAKSMGTATVANKHIMVWETAQGILMLPCVVPLTSEAVADLCTNQAGTAPRSRP
jgi:hypothetical protein